MSNLIPYIGAFFDEWAVTKTMVPGAEALLSTIANISRAAGIHFILSTQYPKAEILNTAISVNFPWRFAFNMQSGSSQSVLGNWDAFGLSPSGRAVLKTNEGSVQVQTPRITERMIFATVEKSKSGQAADTKSVGIDEKDVLTWAIDNVGGKLSLETLFNQFKEKITQAELRDLLKSMESQVFEVHGTQYKIIPRSGNLPRRMELWDEMEQGRSDDAPTDNLQPAEELEEEHV
jgi:DNA segregation ATPase FtsK/SpoIIIE-like protein